MYIFKKNLIHLLIKTLELSIDIVETHLMDNEFKDYRDKAEGIIKYSKDILIKLK